MKKLSFSDPKYYSFGNITKCVYTCKIVDTELQEEMEPFVVSGIAERTDNDDNDPKIGMMLAESRAKIEAFKRVRDSYDKTGFFDQFNELYHMMQGELAFRDRIKFYLSREHEHLKTILKNVDAHIKIK